MSIPRNPVKGITREVTRDVTSSPGGGASGILLTNIMEQWTSSENLLSGSWDTTGIDCSIDVTAIDTVRTVANVGSIRGNLDALYPKANTFTVTVDVEVVSGSADFKIILMDNFSLSNNIASSTITGSGASTRYGAVIDASGALGTTINKAGIILEIGSVLKVKNFMVELVTSRATTNPSTYVPNSVSKLLNGYMEQVDNSTPGDTVPVGCPASGGADTNTTNTGWCWGVSTFWNINNNVLQNTRGSVGDSIHTKQTSIAGRRYNWQMTTSVGATPGAMLVAGQSQATAGSIGQQSGTVVATGVSELVTGTSGVNTELTDVSVVEVDSTTNTDGSTIRSSIGDLTINPTTSVVS